MLHHIKKLFGTKPKEAPAPIRYEDQIQSKIDISFPDSAVAPYKVETPSPAVEAMVTSLVVEGAGTVEVPAKPAKKTAAKKAPAEKKPRAPRKPKAE